MDDQLRWVRTLHRVKAEPQAENVLRIVLQYDDMARFQPLAAQLQIQTADSGNAEALRGRPPQRKLSSQFRIMESSFDTRTLGESVTRISGKIRNQVFIAGQRGRYLAAITAYGPIGIKLLSALSRGRLHQRKVELRVLVMPVEH